MSIYDRSQWPAPASNPLILMFERGDEWYSSSEINACIDPARADAKRSLISNWPTLRLQIGEEDTVLRGRDWILKSAAPQGRTGGLERYYSRKAVILIAMRAQSVNAAAFRDWLAEGIVLDERVAAIDGY